jgi:glucosamine-6-phosphate deaminase
MKTHISNTPRELGQTAAKSGAQALRQALREKGQANIIVATGASQFETLAALVAEPDIDWSRVTGFHLDEYIGLSAVHPASFRLYLKRRFVDLLPLREFHYVNGSSTNPQAECQRLGELITKHPIDVAFVGIGENGHLAFNDPPADFETDTAYLVVTLDEACRQQQAGEGWFATLDDVPRQAISMSCRQILRSKTIICSVPDARKAYAVKNTLEEDVSPLVPATILQTHDGVELFLDQASASAITSSAVPS